MSKRILNCGFFTISPDYVEKLQENPVCDGVDFTLIRTRTYLPVVESDCDAEDVRHLAKTAVDRAGPKAGDVIVLSGSPDVCYYIMELTKALGVRYLCPVGKSVNREYRLVCFREIVPEQEDYNPYERSTSPVK